MSTPEAGRRAATAPYFSVTQKFVAALVVWALAAGLLGFVVALPYEHPAGVLPTMKWLLRGNGEWYLYVPWLLSTAALTATAWWVTRALRSDRRDAAGLGDKAAVRAIAGEQHARDAARHTRRAAVKAGLNVDTCPVNQIGWAIGTSHQEQVVLDLQTQVGVFGPTGMGKTRYLMLNAAHDAPGALVVTTTKLRDYESIIPKRNTMGRVFVWDPLDDTARMYWDPVKGAGESTVAGARGKAFTGDMEETSSDAGKFFGDACALILTRFLMAANASSGTMRDVRRWSVMMDTAGTAAVSIIRKGYPTQPDWADTLAKYLKDSKTSENIQMTLALKMEPLMSEVVMRHLVPTHGTTEFIPADFVRSTDTLIMVTDDNARTNVASLSTMLLNEVTDAAKDQAAITGILDPPLRIVGDEIANVAPLPKLPTMLSDSRGTGIQWVIAAQSLAQLTARWGPHHAEQILANLNAAVVLGGLQDSEALERFSKLAGKVDVAEASASVGMGNHVTGTQYSMRERDVFRAEEIAHLPAGQAFMQLRNARSLIVDLVAHDKRDDT